jgi:hypothetical protein
VLGRDFAAQMEAAFAKDWAAGTTIDRKIWEDRPFVERVREWSARALEVLL